MAARKKGKLGGKTAASPPGRDVNPLFSAHQIWNAGLGAMARAQQGGTKLFDDLVREGSKLQGSALSTAQKVVMQAFQGAQKTVNRQVDGVKGQATETWDNLEKIFQTRVQRALHQLGMPTAEEIGALTRKVNELTDSVDRLARAQGTAKAKGKGKGKGRAKSGAKTKVTRARPTHKSQAEA